jgi:glycosyltransferase involved in cell wall biosynthesis
MNLLQLTHRLPWPPIDGGKKGTLGFVDGYRRHPGIAHHSLICMCPQEEGDWAREWKPEGTKLSVDLMDARNSPVRVLANTLFSSQPFNMAKYQRTSFAALVEAGIRECSPDVVHFDSLHTAWYADLVTRLAPKALKVLRCHNAEHVIMERLAESQTNPAKKALVGLQANRLKHYEAGALDSFDLILAITEADAQRFRAMNSRIDDRMIVVPAGADLPPELPAAPPAEQQPLRMVHIAAMDWIPNQDALRWLLTEVLPRLDHMGVAYQLDVIGKNMPEAFLGWKQDRVTVHGFVKDLQPITSSAQLALVPLQVGGGMRVKILDYWSMGIPVVATRVGAEGLWENDEPVVALADEPDQFAAAIARLAAQPAEREALRSAAFRKVSAHYGWPSLIDSLITRYRGLAPGRA